MTGLLMLMWLLSTSHLQAQELPEVIPPSPTVANLMTFEEVPIDFHTGQPNISIPIYAKQISAQAGLNIALRYNTQGVKVDSRSSWVGTGWSLDLGRWTWVESFPARYEASLTISSWVPTIRWASYIMLSFGTMITWAISR